LQEFGEAAPEAYFKFGAYVVSPDTGKGFLKVEENCVEFGVRHNGCFNLQIEVY